MLNKAVMNGATFHKGFVVLQRLMDSFSNRLLLVYCCLGILLFSLYQFQINPDGVSYLNIAHLYAIGDFHDAINGFWGPLISWLLVPLILLKLQPLFAYKIVSLTISFFTFIAIRKLSYRFAINEEVRLLILIAAIPMLLFYAFLLVTPDLVLLCITLYYFYYIFDADYSKKATQGFIIGFLGALLYFSKSYGFYFFIASFSLFTFIHYLQSKARQERINVVLAYIFGLSVFLIISGIWIYTISSKYQHFTIATAGEYNIRFDSIGSQGQPMVYQGLLPLPYSGAVSAWDDPSRLTIDYEKSPRLVDWITYQIIHIVENGFSALHYFETFSIFSIVILLIYAIRRSGKRFRNAEERNQNPEDARKIHSSAFYALVTMFLYTSGYLLLHIEERFLWVDAILLLLLCGYVCSNHFDFVRNAQLRQFLFFIIFFSFTLSPIKQLIQHVNVDRNIYMTSKQLQTAYHIKGNIASNTNWDETLFYAYFLDGNYYGAAKEKITDEELQGELGIYHINYYFVWNGVCRLSECRKIAAYEAEHLVVYQIITTGSG